MTDVAHRPTWESYFMDITQLVAKRSTCLRRAVGARVQRIAALAVRAGTPAQRRDQGHCQHAVEPSRH